MRGRHWSARRAWCEVFTETGLLQGVTQRYQPNVRMTNLPKIKSEALPAAIDTRPPQQPRHPATASQPTLVPVYRWRAWAHRERV